MEQRDPAFWRDVFDDPNVKPSLFGQSFEAVAPLLENPAVLPFASENGGFLFVGRDNFANVFELHSAFKPAGWGREALALAKAALRRIFSAGGRLIFTHECVGNWRTRPPKSFGFAPCGEEFGNELGKFRLWLLTRDAWEASPSCTRDRELH